MTRENSAAAPEPHFGVRHPIPRQRFRGPPHVVQMSCPNAEEAARLLPCRLRDPARRGDCGPPAVLANYQAEPALSAPARSAAAAPQPLVCGSASIVISSVVARAMVTAIRIVRTMVAAVSITMMAVVAAVSISAAVNSAPIHSPVDARDTERREGASDFELAHRRRTNAVPLLGTNARRQEQRTTARHRLSYQAY